MPLHPGLVTSGWGSIKSSLADFGTLSICVLNCFSELGSLMFWDVLFAVTGELAVVSFR